MASSKEPKFTIVRDTREQQPWSFRATDYCLGHIDKKIDHGDYAIEGFEHLCFIERKASEIELANNITEKRFPKLLLESEKYKYRYIICEFSLDKVLNFPYGSNLPKAVKRRIKISGAYILSKIQDYQIEHGIHIIFCDNKRQAQQFALALFKKIYKRENISV